MEVSRHAIELIEAAPDVEIVADLGESRAYTSTFARGVGISRGLAWRGDFAAAVAEAAEGLRLAQATGEALSIVFGHQFLGLVHIERGDFAAAIPVLERGVALSLELDVPVRTLVQAALLAVAYGLAGRHAAALALLEQHFGADLTSDRWHMRTSRGAAHAVPRAFAAAGDYATAARLSTHILAVHVERGHPAQEAEAHWLLGECATLGDPRDLAAAEVHFRRALELAEACERRPLAAECRLGLGTVCRLVDRRDEAHTWLGEALAAFNEMEMPYWRARAAAEIAALGPAKAPVLSED